MNAHTSSALDLIGSGIKSALSFKAEPILADFIEAHPNFKAAIYLHLPPFASMPMNKISDVIPAVEQRLERERKRGERAKSGHILGYHYDANRQYALAKLLEALTDFTA